jgi:hypothetical protein
MKQIELLILLVLFHFWELWSYYGQFWEEKICKLGDVFFDSFTWQQLNSNVYHVWGIFLKDYLERHKHGA